MPIYKYYCSTCDGRFSHLVRRYDAPPPSCPGCGSQDVEKLLSRVHLGRSDTERWVNLEARSQEVNPEDSREIAKFLQKSGSLAGEHASIDQDAFQEIIARRAEGAEDDDLQDIVDVMPFPRQTFDHPHDPGHEHYHSHGPQCDCCNAHDHAPKKSSPRRAKDLGWA
ncbi:MAG: hypothetical protein GY832_13010 [Chloroflexi bacterium]|nr:hypothetical protein [Chloroflexota bacterium]